ncbi:MAG: pyridoxal-phosphate dependent enzyme [Calditrichaeota bacterium]|nr:MAG: pyridoxal-phosphate dependent enzyme [Calditrichota bacterium]
MNIRDLLNTVDYKASKETKSLSDFVKNPENNLVDRLESFEDIISIEVGDTGLSRAKNLERDYEMRQLFVKTEGDNPTGTQKDRIAFAQVYDALRRDYGTISLATCGNYGSALALATNLAGIKCKIFIPESYHTVRVKEMESNGSEIIRLKGNYEEVVQKSSELAKENDWYDANPGGANTALQILAYSQIAFEIYDQLRDAPKICAVPISNGTLLAGIYRGFVSLYKRGKTSRIPSMLGASSVRKNPIVHSFNKGFEHCVDLEPEKIKETVFNEPLINWHSFDGEEALYAIRTSNGSAFNVSDNEMKNMSKYLLTKESKSILPASTAGLIGLLKLHTKAELEPDRYVAILTAKNSK